MVDKMFTNKELTACNAHALILIVVINLKKINK